MLPFGSGFVTGKESNISPKDMSFSVKSISAFWGPCKLLLAGTPKFELRDESLAISHKRNLFAAILGSISNGFDAEPSGEPSAVDVLAETFSRAARFFNISIAEGDFGSEFGIAETGLLTTK